MAGEGSNRRQFLAAATRAGAALATLAGAGYVGYRWPRHPSNAAAAPSGPDVQRFITRPDLRPPALTLTRHRAPHRLSPDSRCLFLAPKGYAEEGPGQQGAMIVSRDGELVWFLPIPGPDQVPMDFKPQRYRGEPVITWWQGTITDGKGSGVGVIYDASYRQVATVRAARGLEADLHEFLLTDRDTALVTAYETVKADLSAVGGPSDGWVFQGVVQEIDLATGALRFEWRSLDHVGVEETYQPLMGRGSRSEPFDYLHINSIEVAPDGDLVVSARNTWAIYKLSATDGSMTWRLGGRRSDFELAPDARFYWQHDARVLPGNRLSLFDDASSPPKERQSRGLVLRLDEKRRRAIVVHRYLHPAKLLADNQGSLRVLPDGSAIVGWGSQPYTSLYDRDGRLVRDARFPVNDQSYRAFAADWVGRPGGTPSVAVGPNSARGVVLYASWNGATEVRRWQILAGRSAASLAPVVTVPRTDFETAVVVDSDGPWFSAVALDQRGVALGRASAVRARQ